MICLTGDIHHSGLKTENQKHCRITEIQVAQKYLKLLEEADVKVTFFISGKCFKDEWQDLRPICESPLVEIAGHTYNCLEPEILHRIWKKLVRSYNGPAWFQKRDVQKTMKIIEKKSGRKIHCWRNHMFMHGPFTEKVLAECNIKICSDGVKKDSNGLIQHAQGIYNFPLNIIPDHEHLYHAERTPQWVESWLKRYKWSDDFGSQSYYVEEWAEIVLEGLKEHEANGVISNMLIHPITLYLCDKFKTFRKILDYISSCKTVHMSDIYQAEMKKNKKEGKELES